MGTVLHGKKGFSASNLQQEILKVVNPVIDTALTRFKDSTWFDMKFDPATGKDSYDKNEWYSKDKIYSWIQGRGLETIVRTIEFNSSLSGYNLFDKETLEDNGRTLYEKLLPYFGDWTKENKRSFSVPFLLSPNFDQTERENPSLSDVAVLRGLLTWANYSDSPEKPFLIENMRILCKSNLVNDRIDFSTGKQSNHLTQGRMVVIGASMLLYETTNNPEDLMFAIDAIHNDMKFTDDQGNTMEVVGMGLELLRKYGNTIGDSQAIQEKLKTLGLEVFEKAQTPSQTIAQSLDPKTGKLTGNTSPWWSSFETVRALAEIYALEKTDVVLQKLIKHFDAIKVNYLQTSTRIPIQTVDYNGNPVDSIPATPDIDPGFHTCLPLYETYLILSDIATMQVGIATVPIKLKLGVLLRGHTSRTEVADGILDPLSMHTCIFKTSFDIFAVITADLCDIDVKWIHALYKAIHVNFGIKEENITLSTTHIHTGPFAVASEGVAPDKDLYKSLEEATLASVKSALTKAEAVEIKSGVTEVFDIGINRRMVVGDDVMMKPNFSGDIDRKLNLIGFFGQDSNLKGLMAQLALHPTTLGVAIHKHSADYLGSFYAGIKKQYDVPIIVLQGACGDTRPAILSEDKKSFVDGDEKDCQRIGKKLLEGTVSIMKNWDSQESKAIKTVSLQKEAIALKLNVPTKEEVETFLSDSEKELLEVDELTKNMDPFTKAHDSTGLFIEKAIEWAENWLIKEKEGKLEHTVLADFALMKIDDEIRIVFLTGEVFTSIGENLRKKFAGIPTLICGYYEKSIGYLPNEKAFDEGGYEVDRAFRSADFCGPFDRKVEQQVYELFESMK